MASEKITVTVKTLSGNLYELNVNPREGIQGVKKALHKFDQSTFPLEWTSIILEDNTEKITSDSILFAMVKPEPMTTLLSAEEKDNPYHYVHDNKENHWIFRLENEQEIHICFLFHSDLKGKSVTDPGYIVSYNNREAYSSDLVEALSRYNIVSTRDMYIIDGIVQKMNADILVKRRDNLRNTVLAKNKIPAFCECGHLVTPEKMDAPPQNEKTSER